MGKRKSLTAAASAAGMLVLIFDSRTALSGGVEGVELCLRAVIPSLFPFLFLSGCFCEAFSRTSLAMLRPIGKAFSLPRGMEYLLIPAFLGGYPIGAQAVSQARASGAISSKQAERMLAYCSNVGPAFLFGMVISQFGRKGLTWTIWVIQILSAWTASRFFGTREEAAPSAKPPGTASSFHMEAAVGAMLKICGYVILFRILAAFLGRWVLWAVVPWARVMVVGLLELANGCCCLNLIVDEGIRFMVCNLMLAFGGLCVVFQTASVCDGLRLRCYAAGKLLQGAVAVLLAAGVYYRLWWIFPGWFAACLIPRVSKKRVEIQRRMVYNGSR